MSAPPWARYLLAVLAAIGVFVLLPANSVPSAVIYLAIHLSVLGALAYGLRVHRPRPRAAWLVILVGYTIYLVGNMVTQGAATGLLAPLPLPSGVDVLYLATYAAIGLGLMLLLAGRGALRDFAAFADALIILTGIGLFAFELLIGPVLDDATLSPAARLVLAFYPMADQLVLLALLWLAFAPGPRGPALSLLIGGVAAQTAGDAVFGLSSTSVAWTGVIAQPLWLLSFALVGGAALHPSMAGLGTRSGGQPWVPARWRFSLLVLASTAVMIRVISDAYGAGGLHTAVAAVAVVAVVVVFGLTFVRFRELMVDIDVYARTEAERRASEERYRSLAAELDRRVNERTAELTAINEGLRQAKEETERANRAKSEFLSSASHELRTPLNAVLGFAQLLERSDLSPDDRDSVTQILRAGRTLLAMIDSVLELARVESGQLALSIEPVNVEALIHETVDLVRPMAVGRGIRLVTPADVEQPPYVLADRRRIRQVLLNLLTNAVVYNRDDGSVTLGYAIVEGDRLRLSVTDTGPGIPAERQATLFTIFDRRLGSGHQQAGLGVGLALSARLIEAMDGSISVESEVGTGSTFSIELPLAAEPPAEARDGRVGAGTGAPALLTVLYVEDNLANLKLIERVLGARPGTRLLAAMQGRLGRDLARQHHPDLVLLDLHLPDIPGEEVLRLLQDDPATRDIPVIMLSSALGNGQRLRDLGAAAYLSKPIDVAVFLAAVDRILEGGLTHA